MAKPLGASLLFVALLVPGGGCAWAQRMVFRGPMFRGPRVGGFPAIRMQRPIQQPAMPGNFSLPVRQIPDTHSGEAFAPAGIGPNIGAPRFMRPAPHSGAPFVGPQRFVSSPRNHMFSSEMHPDFAANGQGFSGHAHSSSFPAGHAFSHRERFGFFLNNGFPAVAPSDFINPFFVNPFAFSVFSSPTFFFSPFASSFIISRAFFSPFAPIFITPLVSPFLSPFFPQPFFFDPFAFNPFSFEPGTHIFIDPRFSGRSRSFRRAGPASSNRPADSDADQRFEPRSNPGQSPSGTRFLDQSQAVAAEREAPSPRYIAPRQITVTFDGQDQPRPANGRPLVITSGQHSILVTSESH